MDSDLVLLSINGKVYVQVITDRVTSKLFAL